MAVEAREVSCHRACLTSASHVVRYSVEALFVRLFHFCCFFETKFQRDEPSTESLFWSFFIILRKIQNNFWTEKHRSFICSIHSSRWRMSWMPDTRHWLRGKSPHTCKKFGSGFRAQIYQSKTLTLIIVQVLLVGSKCSYQWGLYNFLPLNEPLNTTLNATNGMVSNC